MMASGELSIRRARHRFTAAAGSACSLTRLSICCCNSPMLAIKALILIDRRPAIDEWLDRERHETPYVSKLVSVPRSARPRTASLLQCFLNYLRLCRNAWREVQISPTPKGSLQQVSCGPLHSEF